MRPKQGKGTALVTGGAKRIGASICRTLAEAGYDVVIHYNASHQEAEALAETLRTTGVRVATVQGDLAVTATLPGIIQKAGEAFGPLRLLVNNASLFTS